MFKKLRKWWKNRKQQQNEETRLNGFSWALGQFFSGRKTLTELEDYAQVCTIHHFDQGIVMACRYIRKTLVEGELNVCNDFLVKEIEKE